MNVLIIGNGGREHALAWRLRQSPQADKIFVAPGNAGTDKEPGIENIAIDTMDFPALVAFAKENSVGLTVVGPEAPLVAGVVNYFADNGLRCFGPSQGAAQLEGSKAFTKDFLHKHNIPTAAYCNFTEIAPAVEYVKAQGTPIVIKADGLAAGKGVIIAKTEAEAITAIEDMLSGNKFGDAGHRVVIEQFLSGEEASFIVMVDGENVLPFASSQDHKARDNGDQGPNTGGMGAYSPAPVVTAEVHDEIMRQVIMPTVEGMKKDGNPYVGFLYAGLMISPNGDINVIEYNCRFGDPEAQPVMMRLQSDLIALCNSALDGQLDQAQAQWDPRPAVGVVLASGGYPDAYAKGDIIEGLDTNTDADRKTFHAGTAIKDGKIVSNGGRVLCAVALGDNVTNAQASAYELVKQIHWNNVYYRTDIAYRAIAREQG
ncbi:MAG: phosphoribosylamine--glycine ligase [Pseudohongiellaceae bacterium]|nr:phosphoribosylamine--glycine ligase [Pseudohongiellaceae bacterium]